MLKREDLERLKWTQADVQVWGEKTALLALAAAAPKLALACLESLRVFRMQAEDGDRGERASFEPAMDELEAALAAAGVEVE